MEILFLYLHLIGGICIIFRNIFLTDRLGIAAATSALLYLTITILPVLPGKKSIKITAYCALTAATVLAAGYIPEAGCIVPISITRILILVSLPLPLELILYPLPLFILPDTEITLYLCVSALCMVIFKTGAVLEKTSREQERTIDALESVSQSMSGRIKRLEELKGEHDYFIKLEERNRIAQKLHDELGHTITGSIVQLQAALTILADDPDESAGMIDHVMTVLQSGMKSIRTSLKSLKPPASDIGIQTIKEIQSDLERSTTIRTRLSVSGDISEISQGQWRVIHENVKEAVTNILKHSKASEVVIELAVLNQLIKAGIRDNGRGMQTVNPGMGLRGMEERTGEAGGTLITDGSDGFSVIMIFRKGGSDADPGTDS